MDGKTVLITGATTGLGRQLARDLAVRGARLHLHGRDPERLGRLADEMATLAPEVHTYRADFADLDQVRALAAGVAGTGSHLDVLINNAAVGGGADPRRREVSRQGHELRLAVNHLAPYLLTRELLPLLRASAAARVVNVASMGQAPVDFDDLMLVRRYEGVHAYCRSKLAMIMGSFDLAEEFDDQRVSVNALHPAHLMDTPMVRQSGLTPATGVDDGALPVLRLAIDSTLDGVTGRYFDRFHETSAHPQAYAPAARTRLAELTRALTRA